MITVPEGIKVSLDGLCLTLVGPKGELKKTFKAHDLVLKLIENRIEVETSQKALKKTIEAHINNMLKGVKEGYSRKLKILYSHFPFTLETKGNKLIIKNLLGERRSRSSKIIGNTKIEATAKEVTVFGMDKEAVGQTIANLKSALRIKSKDSRVFQDGVYEIL